jgi:hypothetical protein
VTTGLVIAEAAYLINRQLGPAAEAALYSSVIDGDLEVATLGRADWERVRELVIAYASMPLGGTDASVIALAERTGRSALPPWTGGTSQSSGLATPRRSNCCL